MKRGIWKRNKFEMWIMNLELNEEDSVAYSVGYFWKKKSGPGAFRLLKLECKSIR